MNTKFTARSRALVVSSKSQRPKMTPKEIAALAHEHGISIAYARSLRAEYRHLKNLPRSTGRRPKLTSEQQAELGMLCDLKHIVMSHLTCKALSERFGISPVTVRTYRLRQINKRIKEHALARLRPPTHGRAPSIRRLS